MSTKQGRTKQGRKAAGTTGRSDGARRRIPVIAVAFAAVAVVLIVVLAMGGNSGESGDELGSPTVSGDALPLFGGDTASDPAVGMIAPEVTGTDFDGSAVRITHDGVPKAIAVLAHWCPNCQAEVPAVQAWIEAGGLPNGVAIYTVSTSVGSTRANYPPSDWFAREGWTPPVVRDDAAQSVGTAFGVSGYPFWLFVEGDGTVVARTAGSIDIPVVQGLLELMAPVG